MSIFFALKMFWRILKLAINSYSCLAFIFTRCICTSPGSTANRTREPFCRLSEDKDGKERARTVDGVHDLAVGSAGPALFDFGVVDLEEVVQPRDELCP